MPQWEYRAIEPERTINPADREFDWSLDVDGETVWGLTAILDGFGSKGWELAAAGPAKDSMGLYSHWRYVFKRPVPSA
jgi:hypothetical protein